MYSIGKIPSIFNIRQYFMMKAPPTTVASKRVFSFAGLLLFS